MDGAIADWTARHKLSDLEEMLHAADVPAARIFTMKDIFADDHYKARDMLLELPDENLGSITVPGIVPRLSETPGSVRWAGREVGADTRSVLMTVAEFEAEEVDALIAGQAVYSADTDS